MSDALDLDDLLTLIGETAHMVLPSFRLASDDNNNLPGPCIVPRAGIPTWRPEGMANGMDAWRIDLDLLGGQVGVPGARKLLRPVFGRDSDLIRALEALRPGDGFVQVVQVSFVEPKQVGDARYAAVTAQLLVAC